MRCCNTISIFSGQSRVQQRCLLSRLPRHTEGVHSQTQSHWQCASGLVHRYVSSSLSLCACYRHFTLHTHNVTLNTKQQTTHDNIYTYTYNTNTQSHNTYTTTYTSTHTQHNTHPLNV